MMNTFPVFSTLLSPEVLAAASVTRIAFLEDSPVSKKPFVSSIIDISARARALAESDATASAAPYPPASAAPTERTAMAPVQGAATETAVPTAAATPAPAVTHINPPPTVVDPFADPAAFSKAQANSFATAQAVAAYYLMSGFGKEASNVAKGVAYLPPSTLVSPVNPVARIAALKLELHH